MLRFTCDIITRFAELNGSQRQRVTSESGHLVCGSVEPASKLLQPLPKQPNSAMRHDFCAERRNAISGNPHDLPNNMASDCAYVRSSCGAMDTDD